MKFLVVGIVFVMFFLLVFIYCSFGQLVKRQFVYSAGKAKAWGYLYRPVDRSKKYPTVLFYHSNGNSGKSSGDADRLLLYGPLKFIRDGSFKPAFNVLALQASSWTFTAANMMGAIRNDTELVEMVDTSKIVLMGIGAGGSEMSKWLAADYPAKGAIFCSPVEVVGFAGRGLPSWLFLEDNDRADVKASVNSLKQYLSGERVSVYPGNFCCWNTVCNPSWKENGKSMYDWIDSVVAPKSPLVMEGANLIYTGGDNVLRIDTGGVVVVDTIGFKIVEYRLSNGEVVVPGSKFVWIFDFKNNSPSFLLPSD